MMKHYILILMCSLISQFAWSQSNIAEGFCLTPPGEITTPPPTSGLRTMGAYDCPKYQVRVYFHFVNSNSNPGFTASDIPTVLANLNNVYNSYGISFISSGSRTWTDEFWGSPTTNQLAYPGIFQATGANPQPNAINIYMLPRNCQVNGGFAEIPSTALLMGGVRPTTFNCQTINYVVPLTRVVAHELGHCFGLNHTMTREDGNGDGDGLSDTPLDFVFDNSCTNPTTCQFTPTQPNGCSSCPNATNPTTNRVNVMSYTVEPCMREFSPMQMAIIRQKLASNYGGIVSNINTSFCPCSAPPNLQSMNYVQDGGILKTAITVNNIAPNVWYTLNTNIDPNTITSNIVWNPIPYTPSSPFNGYATGTKNTQFRFKLSTGQTFELKNITATNSCGTSIRWMVFNTNGTYSYSVYPNAAKETLTVQFDEAADEADLPSQLNLINQISNIPIRSVDLKNNKKALTPGNKLDIDVKDLPRGVYYLQIINVNRKREIRRVILE